MLCHANAQIVEAIFLSFPPLIAVGTGLNNFIETKGYNFDKYVYQLQSTWNQIPTQVLLLLFFLLSCFLSMCIATNIQPLFNMVDVVHDFNLKVIRYTTWLQHHLQNIKQHAKPHIVQQPKIHKHLSLRETTINANVSFEFFIQGINIKISW